MAPRSATFDLANRVMGGGLVAWLLARKAEGYSWARIASRLYAEHDLDLSAVTLQRWAEAPAPAEEASA